jgi:hypothetical protein
MRRRRRNWRRYLASSIRMGSLGAPVFKILRNANSPSATPRSRRQQILRFLHYQADIPETSRVRPLGFPELPARRLPSRTDCGCDTLRHLMAELSPPSSIDMISKSAQINVYSQKEPQHARTGSVGQRALHDRRDRLPGSRARRIQRDHRRAWCPEGPTVRKEVDLLTSAEQPSHSKSLQQETTVQLQQASLQVALAHRECVQQVEGFQAHRNPLRPAGTKLCLPRRCSCMVDLMSLDPRIN